MSSDQAVQDVKSESTFDSISSWFNENWKWWAVAAVILLAVCAIVLAIALGTCRKSCTKPSAKEFSISRSDIGFQPFGTGLSQPATPYSNPPPQMATAQPAVRQQYGVVRLPTQAAQKQQLQQERQQAQQREQRQQQPQRWQQQQQRQFGQIPTSPRPEPVPRPAAVTQPQQYGGIPGEMQRAEMRPLPLPPTQTAQSAQKRVDRTQYQPLANWPAQQQQQQQDASVFY